MDALVTAHRRGARLVSICSGVFVLAATGLLDGRRTTTHWRYTESLARQYPRIRIEPDVLYVDEGDVLTSAGSAAGMDLGLHIIRGDFGARVANQVARRLVMPPHREGGQAQFVPAPVGDEERPWLAHLFEWAQRRVHEDLTVARLAREARMSTRTLSRRFAETAGVSPAHWVIGLRVAKAKDLLETSRRPVERIASDCGFGSAPTLRHHFRRRVGMSPTSYRARFRTCLTGRGGEAECMPANRSRRNVFLAIVALVALVFAVPTLVGVLTDWWWFQEIGYQVVFTRELTTQLLLFLSWAPAPPGVLYLNLRIAQRGMVLDPIVFAVGPSSPQLDVTRSLRRVSLPVVLVLGLLAGFAATSLWDVALQAINRTPFGTVDPVFGRDIGFYVFTLPALVGGARVPLRPRPPLAAVVSRSTSSAATSSCVPARCASSRRPGSTSRSCSRRCCSSPPPGSGWWTARTCSTRPPARWSAPATPTSMAALPALRVSAVVAVVAAVAVLVGALRERLPPLRALRRGRLRRRGDRGTRAVSRW